MNVKCYSANSVPFKVRLYHGRVCRFFLVNSFLLLLQIIGNIPLLSFVFIFYSRGNRKVPKIKSIYDDRPFTFKMAISLVLR